AEQQVLNRLIELELQLTRNLGVERIDRGIERGHAIAVADRSEGGGDLRCRRPGLIGDADHERGTATIDYGICELGSNDLAPQPMMLERIGEFFSHRIGKIAAKFEAELGIVGTIRVYVVGIEEGIGV